ncbi:hypothetical protein BDV33DRAFT_113675 [Aspergillus novoparasiticus]|uniref:Uncharacterized protein n=1 Tax=Aspergillus novoparasiticus TaxID=986946 RepID=A0A5N6ENW7_9EURO|nr:hypothetical protein BDV33DRAFT_113675 [Aspergillus novoparasiticus]
MHILERVKHDLATKGRGQYSLKVDQFDLHAFVSGLERNPARMCYNSFTETLSVEMPSWIHGSGFDWINMWIFTMMLQGYIRQGSLLARTCITLEGFSGRFSGRYLTYSPSVITACTNNCSTKEPDCFIVPGGIWPSVTLEVGYSETYTKLLRDADLLLEGSEGEIRVMILVKVVPLGPNDTQFTSGFVELHEYDPASGTRKIRGHRRTLYPIPRGHAQQRLTLQWDDIIRDNTGHLLQPLSRPPPPLMLDELRKFLDFGLNQKLMSPGTGSVEF